MSENRTIRVFVSSPSDVRPERLIAERVVKRLAREFSYHFPIEAVLWEREPLLATHHFQDLIVPPHETDIVVTVLWSRLGVPLPEAKYLGAISKAPVTGTEWEFEDAVASYQQRGLPELLLYRKRAKVTVELGDRAILEEQQHQSELVEEFMRHWFRSLDGKSFVAASREFADATEFESLLEEHLRALLSKLLTKPGDIETPATITWHQGSPYRGLEPFEIEHASIFFGRMRARNEIREVLARQIERGCGFVLVTGASGSGKSSLVKAGVLPDLLLPGMVGRVALCRYVVTRPGATTSEASRGALGALARAVFAETALPELGQAPLEYTADRLRELFDKAPTQSAQPIRQGLSAAGQKAGLTERGEARLVLVVDQLEELFTAGITQEMRERYIAALDALARSGLVWIIATMRSDFFDRIPTLPSLVALSAGEGTYLLAPPDAADIGQIIRLPAREAGLRFEIDERAGHSLDEVIREAAAKDPASLPLLEYLLDQLWHQRSADGMLTFRSYEALKGLEGAIGERAEQVLRDLPDAVREAFPAVLRALVTVGQSDTAVPTARLVPLSTFAEGSAQRSLVEALIHPQARILVAYGDGSAARVRVAHEALLTHWERARLQIAADRQDLRTRARIEADEAHWREAQIQDRAGLLLPPGRRLAEGEELLARRRAELDPALVTFIEASVRAAGEADRRRTRVRRLVTAALGVAAIVVAVVVLVGLSEKVKAERGAELATSRQWAAQALADLDVRAPHSLLLALNSISLTRKAGAFSQTDSTQLLNHLLNSTGGFTLQHAAPVAAIALSPDDRWLAAANAGEVKLWDMQGLAKTPKTLSGHDKVNKLAFSPDGRMLATVGNDTTLRLWDMAAADPAASVRVLTGHSAPIVDVAFAPDGRRLATASADSTVGLWDPTAPDPAATKSVLAHDAPVNSLAFSPDGHWLATSSKSTVRFWNLLDPDPSARPGLAHLNDNILTVAFSPDSQWLVAGATESLRAVLMRVTAPEKPFELVVESWVPRVAFSPDGRWLATPGLYNARLWDLNKPDPSREPLILGGHQGFIADLAFSSDGTWFATGSLDHTVQLRNAADHFASSAVLRGHEGPISSLAFTADGRRLVSASEDRTVRLWNTSSPAAEPLALRAQDDSTALHMWDLRGASLAGAPRSLEEKLHQYAGTSFSPDGKWLATISRDDGANLVWLWNLSTPSPRKYVVHHGEQIWATPVFSPDARWLVTAGVANPTINLWDLKAPDPTRSPRVLGRHSGPVRSLAISSDGRRLVSGANDGYAFVWDVTAANPSASILRLPGGDGRSIVHSVAISDNGRYVITGSWEPDFAARIWDLSQPASLSRPITLNFKARVDEVAFSPDGRWAAAGSWDKTTQLLDLAKPGAKPFVLEGHTARTLSVAFSPDSQWLVTGNEDRTARLWNLAAADPSTDSVVLHAPNKVGNVSFSRDGRWVAFNQSEFRSSPFSPDGFWFASTAPDTRLYHTRLEDLVLLACRTAGRNLTANELLIGDVPLDPKICPEVVAGE